MRLIDADALAKKCCTGIEEFGTCEKCLEYYARKGCDRTCYLEYRGEDVRNAPTIDAIPVEWLENRLNTLCFEAMGSVALYGDRIGELAKSINEVMKLWQKEQEAQE